MTSPAIGHVSSRARTGTSTISYVRRHPTHGKRRRANPHDEKQETESTRRFRSDATHPTVTSIAEVFDRPRTCAYADMNRLKSNGAIPATRVRAPRSVSDESTLTVLAALSGVGIGHYSRRLRQGTSEERFPAYSAGRRPGEHLGDAHLLQNIVPSRALPDSSPDADCGAYVPAEAGHYVLGCAI
jgi:hypothetical protein